jgi:hypothetical protein
MAAGVGAGEDTGVADMGSVMARFSFKVFEDKLLLV